MSLLSEKGIVICDVDGTILDRMELFVEIFADIAAEKGVDRKTAVQHYILSAGAPIEMQFGGMFEFHNLSIPFPEVEICGKEFFTRVKLLTEAPLFPDAHETLRKL